jgi:hypothetical protein
MINEEPFKKYNEFLSQLSLEQINNLSDEEIHGLAIARPDHPGQYGFMLQLPYFKSTEHLAATMQALLQRLAKAKR